MALTQEKLGLEEFLQLPEDKPALEYFEGMVSQKVSPKGRHGVLQSELVERINVFARPRRIARAITEVRFTFDGASTVPDVSVVRSGRIPYDAKGIVVDDLLFAPDIAIEIVSPEQRTNALLQRCLWYVSHGVQIALLVDPDHESVAAFRQGKEPRVLSGPERIDLDEVLPSFELTVAELFSTLRRP